VDEDKVAELGEHLQTAALELIAAARVVLDLAEEVVKEPGGTMALIQHLGPKPRPADGPASPRVERIRVS
jgi:hypothetical protein